jgi:hypothetical protein
MKLSISRAMFALAAAVFSASGVARAQGSNPLRPPAVPLVTVDPYLSIWSEADKLTDRATRHWTGHAQPLVSLIRIDGNAFRLMGNDPTEVPPLPQNALVVTPTKTTYTFTGSGVKVVLSFLTPLLPSDLDVMSRPVTYLTWEVSSTDGQAHAVQLFDSTSGLLTVDKPNQKITWSTEKAGDLTMLKIGTVDQRMLANAGDDTRIDWGYAYTVAKTGEATSNIGGNAELLNSFVATGKLPETDDKNTGRAADDDQPICGFAFDLGQVSTAPVTRQVMLGYDEIKAIKYFGKPLQPYWRRDGAEPADLFQECEKQYAQIEPKCEAFDAEVIADAAKLGGDPYAKIVSLAYRQAWAGCGLCVDANKQPHLFCKENSSDGNLATVDVFFPMDPIWILFSPGLAKSTMAAVFEYSMTDHWKFPNAPHDIGEYPQVFGRDNGGEGMPVEESGNMLILADAIAQTDGNADWVKPWWPKCRQWAEYLEKYGLDPEEQLCTDDFMGHLAHNSNLSVKAILGLAAYGDMCRMRGDTAEADRYRDLAKADARHWMKVALDDSGDHYRLAFDKPGTWSQKYNLVWDKILGLNVFPPEVAQKEVAWYKTQLQQYGLPLDSRTKLTKTDWTCWSATLADNPADFETLISPIIGYLDNTTARVPFVDSYVTNDIHSDGMRARPVIGGVFIRFLSDKAIWKKWSSRDTLKPSGWESVPPPPTITEVVPTAKHEPVTWLYTTEKPADSWMKTDFDTAGWKSGLSGFGTEGTPGLVMGTKWDTADIWIRREFTLPANLNDGPGDLQFLVKHDEDIEIYVDGVLAASCPGFDDDYVPLEITASAKALLVPGKKVTIAAHCHQTTGGQGIDIGICRVVEGK